MDDNWLDAKWLWSQTCIISYYSCILLLLFNCCNFFCFHIRYLSLSSQIGLFDFLKWTRRKPKRFFRLIKYKSTAIRAKASPESFVMMSCFVFPSSWRTNSSSGVWSANENVNAELIFWKLIWNCMGNITTCPMKVAPNSWKKIRNPSLSIVSIWYPLQSCFACPNNVLDGSTLKIQASLDQCPNPWKFIRYPN